MVIQLLLVLMCFSLSHSFSLSSFAPGPDTVLGLVGAELRHL